MNDLKLNVDGALKLMDERDALRAALEKARPFVAMYEPPDTTMEQWTDAVFAIGAALALGTGSKAPHNQPSATSGLTDLLTDLLDYFEPRMEADCRGDGSMAGNAEMKFWTRIKEVRGER